MRQCMIEPETPPASTAITPNYERWTRPKMVAFLHALASTRSVSGAAKAVGMSRNSAYRLRARHKGQPFDLAWGAALENAWIQFRCQRLDGET